MVITVNSLDIWILNHDGTLDGLSQAFEEAKRNNIRVSEFNLLADSKGLPRNLGRWMLFSVLEKETYETS